MARNALVDSFCRNQKKCGTERVKALTTEKALSWQYLHILQTHFYATV